MQAIADQQYGEMFISMPFFESEVNFTEIDFTEDQVSGSKTELISKIRSLNINLFDTILGVIKSKTASEVTQNLKSNSDQQSIGIKSQEINDMFAQL